MPSVSKKQHNLMAAVAKNPAFAKKVGIKQSVGEEFLQADKGKKFAKGGEMKKLFGGKESRAEETKEAKALKSGRISKQQYVAGEKSEGHGAGATKKATAIKSGRLSPKAYAEEHKGMKKGGKCMASGGLSSGHKSADGIATKGKTKAKQVTMKRGGKC